MRRNKLTPLIFIVLVAVLAIGAVFATGTSPQLGLDLQGGVSVVLQPTKATSDEALNQTIEVIRSRVDALGVAEPDIVRQGNSVVVQLPGVKNQQRAIELVGTTAELRFRPVIASIPGSVEDLQRAASTTTTTTNTATTVAPITGQSTGQPAAPFQEPVTTTGAPGGTSPAPVPAGDPIPAGLGEELLSGFEVTAPEDDLADQPVVLETIEDGKVTETSKLGPTAANGTIVETAKAELGPTGEWSVNLVIKGGSGIEQFNAIAAECNSKSEICPSGRLAIVLDSQVVSAPNIEQPSFERDQIQISGSFNEREAKDLALVLRYGSLPVVLETQTVQTVSPTLGSESLKSGLLAGLLGLSLVVIYMIFYYRALGVVVLLGLMIWAALNYAIISWLGATRGLALSLAGGNGPRGLGGSDGG